MSGDNSDAIEVFKKQQLEQQQQEKGEQDVNILQQMDAKILLNFLKGNPNATQVNIVNVGTVSTAANGDNNELLVKRLLDEITDLKMELKEAKKFGVLEWLKEIPQPRYKNMLRALIITLKEQYAIQKDAALFLGVSERQFSYWMKTHSIPGYRPRSGKEE